MRGEANAEKIRALLEAIGARAKGPGKLYLVGGASAVLEGWRKSTIDVDLKLEPEPAGIFEALRDLKDELDLNIELASPDHFIPAGPDWAARSVFVGQFGPVEVYHFDFVIQALAKIERGHQRDLDDVHAMLARRLVTSEKLEAAFATIEPQLVRYPGLDATAFRAQLREFLGSSAPHEQKTKPR